MLRSAIQLLNKGLRMRFKRKIVLDKLSNQILNLLAEKDMHGYEIICHLKKHSNNTFSKNSGNLYPLLDSLIQKGYLKTYDQKTKGKTRKFFKLTFIYRLLKRMKKL